MKTHRPTSLTVFGVLNLVFAFIGLIGVVILGNIAPMLESTPELQAAMQGQEIPSVSSIELGISIVRVFLLAISGIGILLLNKMFGYFAGIAYAMLSIVGSATASFGNSESDLFMLFVQLIYPLLLIYFLHFVNKSSFEVEIIDEHSELAEE
jgi:hypothetical protein